MDYTSNCTITTPKTKFAGYDFVGALDVEPLRRR